MPPRGTREIAAAQIAAARGAPPPARARRYHRPPRAGRGGDGRARPGVGRARGAVSKLVILPVVALAVMSVVAVAALLLSADVGHSPGRSGEQRAVAAAVAPRLLALRVAKAPAGARATAGAAVPDVLTCSGKVVVEPKQFILACADANSYFVALRWMSWTAAGAVAAGTYRENDCLPNCAAGHFHSYPGTLRFMAPKRTASGELFSEAVYSYTTTESQSLPTRPLR